MYRKRPNLRATASNNPSKRNPMPPKMEPLDQDWYRSKKAEGKSNAWVIGYVLETVDYFPRIEVDPKP